MREKGNAIGMHVGDYCIVDLETTGVFIKSARIIEIAALKIRDNHVVDEYSTLINPQCHIPDDATAINNITDDMVKDAPQLCDAIDSFLNFVQDDIIVGYNNASFDLNVIYDAVQNLRGIIFNNDYIDILYSARRCLPELENHKLETLSKFYSLDTTGEHRGLKDCYLTKECYDKLFNEFGEEAFISRRHHNNSSGFRTQQYSSETLALQELQMLLEDIIEDGEVTLEEVSTLKRWVETHRDLQGKYPFDRVFNALDVVLEDGQITDEELNDLQELFSYYVDPISNIACDSEISTLTNKHICITGDFDFGNRTDVFELIEKAGGIIDKSVKKSTNYLIVGSKGSDNWKTKKYGCKVEKAMKMIDEGKDIKIIDESNFIPAVEKILENGQEFDESHEVDWKQSIRDMLDSLIDELELPQRSLNLSDNLGKNNEIISHTVYIWEPDYPPMPNAKPTRNRIVLTIFPSTAKSRPDDLDIAIREVQEGDLHEYLPLDAELLKRTKTDIDTNAVRVRIKKYSPNLTEYVKRHTTYCIGGYESKATRFGCCDLFMKCSDAKKCVHENKLYTKACMYRDNLDQGRIFYGKNRNID